MPPPLSRARRVGPDCGLVTRESPRRLGLVPAIWVCRCFLCILLPASSAAYGLYCPLLLDCTELHTAASRLLPISCPGRYQLL
ncbi:hypothetical protein ACFXTO_015285 [Malus domestica]